MDANGDGRLSMGEVEAACALVNRRLKSMQRASGPSAGMAASSLLGSKASLVPGISLQDATAAKVEGPGLFRTLDVDSKGVVDVMSLCRSWLRLFASEFQL